MKKDIDIEPILILLLGGVVFFTLLMIGTNFFFPNDGQVFTTISNLISGFSGAFFMRVKSNTEKNVVKGDNVDISITKEGGK